MRHTTRRGQDKLAEIQNILHETITGNRIVKAFSMEIWEIARFRNAAQRLFRANMRSVAAAAVSSPLMDIFGAVAIALLLLLGREQISPRRNDAWNVSSPSSSPCSSLYDPVRKFAVFYNNFQQALGASSEIFKFMDAEDEVREKPQRASLAAVLQKHPLRERLLLLRAEGDEARGSARHQPGSEGRRSAGDGRLQRRRQEHAGASDPALLRCDRGTHC